MKAPTAPSVGERLFLWRRSRGWTQEELAKQAEVSRTAISLTEEEHTKPRLSTLRKIAWTFDTDIDGFLNGPIPERERET